MTPCADCWPFRIDCCHMPPTGHVAMRNICILCVQCEPAKVLTGADAAVLKCVTASLV